MMSHLTSTPIIWSIAGSDCSSYAGIQADIKTANNLSVHCYSIISAVTSQNSKKLVSIMPTNNQLFTDQIAILHNGYRPTVVKSGMIANEEQAITLSKYLNKNSDIFYICDPVSISSSGSELCSDRTKKTIKSLLFPRANLLTPNLHEAIEISNINHNNIHEIAKKIIKDYKCSSVLIKGGHIDETESTDLYATNDTYFSISHKRNYNHNNIRGTGCALSTAIASEISKGLNIYESIFNAKQYISYQIKNAININDKNSIMRHINITSKDYPTLPNIYSDKNLKMNYNFSNPETTIGLYPIVNEPEKIHSFSNTPVKIVQLRVKNKTHDIINREIKKAVAICKQYNIKLFVNDYWELAIKHKAYGVHLGQKDITAIALKKISDHGLYLGISTHSRFELALALSISPSYIALGPIYKSNTKSNLISLDHGISKIREWKYYLKNIPLVAIGGIKLEHMNNIYNAGANGIAVIEFLSKAENINKSITDANNIFLQHI